MIESSNVWGWLIVVAMFTIGLAMVGNPQFKWSLLRAAYLILVVVIAALTLTYLSGGDGKWGS